jgi:hypothetical protein
MVSYENERLGAYMKKLGRRTDDAGLSHQEP